MNQIGEELRCKVEENEKLKDRILELSQRVDALLEVNNIPNLDKAIAALKNGEFYATGNTGFNVFEPPINSAEELAEFKRVKAESLKMAYIRPYQYNTNGIDLIDNTWCICNDFGKGYNLKDYGKTWWLTEEEAMEWYERNGRKIIQKL